jgi:ABC-type transporter Mla MlaB component
MTCSLVIALHNLQARLRKLLKISTHEEPDQIVLRVEGKLIAPWTTELEKEWQALAKTLANKTLCLDIRNATFVDQKGLELLAKIIRVANTNVLADTPLTRQFAEQARQIESSPERKKP